MWQKTVIVGIGGFLGAQQRFGPSFPVGTLVINASGSFAIGLFLTLSNRLLWSDEWRLAFAIGFLGAYTTFSTFSWETLQLIAEGRRYGAATANIAWSILLTLLGCYLGIVTGRLLLRARL